MGGGRSLFKYIDCIDACTDYCPCSLAEVGECLLCSQLKGDLMCDCVNYGGTCIYQEFIWNNEKSKRLRQFKIYSIKNKRYLREDIVLFEIKLNGGLVRELNSIGAFVFLKKPGDADSCSVPISILDCDIYNNEITVAVKIIGVKTKMLEGCTDVIMVKGPYWNGLQGQRFLKDLKDKNILLIGRGCALPPTILASKKLLKKDNNIYAILEKGRGKESAFKQYFDRLNIYNENINLINRSNVLQEEGKALIKKLLEEKSIEVVISAGDDIFHERIINFIYSINKKINFSTVNNATMCCGEGQCGSCLIHSPGGERIKACKQQYNPKEVFLKEGAAE